MTRTSTTGGLRLGDVAARTARPYWRLHYSRRIQLAGVAFVLPTILFFLVFKYGPMVWAVELSFTSYDMVSTPRWTALENYRSLAVDPVFRESLWVTLVYIAGSTILITLVGLGLALAVNTAVPGARYCMGAMFLTNLMPIIAVCLVWRFLLHPYGLVNQLLEPLGVGPRRLADRFAYRDAGHHRRHGLALRPLFHDGVPGRPARDPEGLLRGRAHGRRPCAAPFPAHHAAASDARSSSSLSSYRRCCRRASS